MKQRSLAIGLLLSVLAIAPICATIVRAEDGSTESQQEQAREQAQKQIEAEREAAKKAIEESRESTKKQIEKARETAKQERETLIESYKNKRESLKEQLSSIIEQLSSASPEEKAAIQTQLTAKVAEMEKNRTELRTSLRTELEKFNELKQEQLSELAKQRAEQLAALAERREELRAQAQIEITTTVRAERLEKVTSHALAMNTRLDAATARALSIATKLKTRIDQLADATLKNKLSSDLAQLTVTEQELAEQVAAAKTALTGISGSDDVGNATATARDQVETAVATFRSLLNGYATIANQLPQ